jgi:tRNA A37 threonylcarbamoyladenosine synthetase subunit TsaC/SUA5/YrdC
MAPPNVVADAQRVYDVLKDGGTAIVPMSVGYAICSTNPSALEKIFSTKQRGAHKRHGMGGSYEFHKQIHIMKPLHAEIVHTLVKTLGLPLGVVARYDRENPVIRNIDDLTLKEATEGESMAMLIGAGELQDEIIRLTSKEDMPVLGSSANMSGTGLYT